MSKRAIFLSGKRGGGGYVPTTTTTTWQVSAGGDDGWAQHGTTTTMFTGDALIGGFFVYSTGMGGMPYGTYAFCRFQNVGIPQGATIDTAKLTFKTQATSSGGAEHGDLDAHTFKVDAIDEDDVSAPSAASDVNDSAATTEEIVDWSLTSSVADDADLDTPEIKTVLQEIVNRGGWASGNAVMFRYYSEETDSSDSSGSTVDCRLDVQSYEESSSNAAKLVVTYTA
jgi:hypothetical protein